jgi:hypothetical protein
MRMQNQKCEMGQTSDERQVPRRTLSCPCPRVQALEVTRADIDALKFPELDTVHTQDEE